MKCVEQWLGRNRALILFCLALPCNSFGQDIDPERVTEEDVRENDFIVGAVLEEYLESAQFLASSLLDRNDFVADGEFFAIPQSSPEESRTLNPENVIVKFRIHTLYKGRPTDSIEIELPNDMLIVPGENVSRYFKRRMIENQQHLDLQPVFEQRCALDRAFATGRIDRQEYERERVRLHQLESERIGKDGLATGRLVGAIHGNTFYDDSGAIREDEKYLVGLNRDSSGVNVFVLDDYYSNSAIHWGELRDYILSALTEPMR